MNCILCDHGDTTSFKTRDQNRYWRCLACALCFLDPEFRLAPEVEKDRYLLHQTKSIDEGYRRFVAPLLDAVEKNCAPRACGLDFGAGHQPVLAELLEERKFSVAVYDPFFWPDTQVLTKRYDFVTACEVVEHFFAPAREFAKLRELVKPGGVMIINTEPCAPADKFENWYYRRDPSHVAFYSDRTFAWIARRFGFRRATYLGRVAVLD